MEEETKLNPVRTKPANMEDVLEKLGGFGRFQFMVLFLILSMEIPTAFLMLVPVFIGASPSIWLCDGAEVNKSEVCSCTGNITAADPSVSVVAEWNLICGSAWVSDTIISFQMSGILLGSLYASQLSDWYGRRYCFFGITLQMALGTVLTAVAPNYYVYAFARFLCGAGFSGFMSVSAIYSMEFMTPKWRPLAGAIGPFGEGIMLLGLLAYFVRPWRLLIWITALPFAALLFIFPLLPESPRWLLRNRKLGDCHKILGYIAHLNGYSNVDIETLRIIMEEEGVGSKKYKEQEPELGNMEDGCVTKSSSVKQFSFQEFFRNPTLRKTTLCLQGLWFTWGLVYFGLSYNIKNMPGSPYLNLVLMGLVDAIGQRTVLFVSNRIGRRKSLVTYMTISAVFLVSIAVLQLFMDVNSHAAQIAILCLIGRYGIAGARCSLRTLTGESFPTAIRVMGIGITGCASSLGGALAPQIVFLGSYWPSFPFFAFALISVGGSSVSFLLRETTGQPLEEEMRRNAKTKR